MSFNFLDSSCPSNIKLCSLINLVSTVSIKVLVVFVITSRGKILGASATYVFSIILKDSLGGRLDAA